MNPFQLLGISLFACLILAQTSRMVLRRSIPRSSLAWVLVWSAGIFALSDPNRMTRIARALGVSRGADLLLYVSVLCGLLVAFEVYTRMRRTDRQITLIVRQLALSTPDVPVGFSSVGGESFDALGEEDPDDGFFRSGPGGPLGSEARAARESRTDTEKANADER